MSLRLENVSFLKEPTLQDVHLVLEKGVHGLLSEKGRERETLLSLMAGTLRPSSGRILLDDAAVSAWGSGYFDRVRRLPGIGVSAGKQTVGDYLSKLAPKAPLDAILELVELPRDLPIAKSTAVQRQQLRLAQALLTDPAVLLLEDPSVGLDEEGARCLQRVLTKMGESRAVLIATCEAPLLTRLAETVFVLSNGNLIHIGSPAKWERVLAGNVWELRLSSVEEASYYFCEHLVTRAEQQGDSFVLRVISGEAPDEKAVSVPPALEDIWVFFMHKNGAV